MSQNRPGNENDFGGTSNSGGGSSSAGIGSQAGGGSSSAGTGISTTGGGSGAAAGTATAPSSGGIGDRAKQYGQTVADAATQAKDYITDKAGVVGEKIQGLKDVDYAEYANQAKDYARQNPGQALLVAAAAGFVIGLLVRGGRR